MDGKKAMLLNAFSEATQYYCNATADECKHCEATLPAGRQATGAEQSSGLFLTSRFKGDKQEYYEKHTWSCPKGNVTGPCEGREAISPDIIHIHELQN